MADQQQAVMNWRPTIYWGILAAMFGLIAIGLTRWITAVHLESDKPFAIVFDERMLNSPPKQHGSRRDSDYEETAGRSRMSSSRRRSNARSSQCISAKERFAAASRHHYPRHRRSPTVP